MSKKSEFETRFAAGLRALQKPTREWLIHLWRDYDGDEHHWRTSLLAGQAWDESQQARETLAREGQTYADRFGQPRARPEVAIERDSRLAFARLVREMNLDIEPPAQSRLPRGARYSA